MIVKFFFPVGAEGIAVSGGTDGEVRGILLIANGGEAILEFALEVAHGDGALVDLR